MTRWLGPTAGLAALAWLAVSAALAVATPAQEIAFTTSPPTNAVVGGSYEASAKVASGEQVYISASGACSLQTPAEAKTEPAAPRLAPALVHFIEAGECVVEAMGTGEYEEETPKTSQTFLIAEKAGSSKGPGKAPEATTQPEAVQPGSRTGPRGTETPGKTGGSQTRRRPQRIRFASRAPKSPKVRGHTYRIDARASSGLRVAVSSVTPRVCRVHGRAVRFLRPGRCKLRATQRGDREFAAARPAYQSFLVRRR